MVRTRATKDWDAAEDEEQHQDEQDLVNPTRQENWPRDPTTQEEFAQWLIDTKAALLSWLQQAGARAQDDEVRNEVEQFVGESKENWREYEEQVDVQTGTINLTSEQDALDKSMAREASKRARLHKDLRTHERFYEYIEAQSAWEDFLYYQNVWNRKKDSSQRFIETPDERMPVSETGIRQTDNDQEKIRGTQNSRASTRKTPYGESMFWKYHEAWMLNMIKLYRQFGLGYRKQIPPIVGPNDVHRYSQPPRGTTPQNSHSYKRRHRHLEERFPRQKRKIEFEELEFEEMYRKKEARLKDNQLSRRGEMTPISWKLDDESYDETRIEKEEESADGFRHNPRTKESLPDGHQTHHSSLEKSFDWPTSFESARWGNNMSRTAMKLGYVYEEISSDSEDDDRDRYKRDEKGNKIKKLAPRPYRMRVITEEGQDFHHDMNSDGTVEGRDRQGRWRGLDIEGPVEKYEFALNEKDERIVLPDRYELRREFTTRIVRDQKQRTFRRERHQSENVTDQLSEDEADDCISSNKNWTRSGNANPEQVGRFLPPNHGGGLDQGDSDSDDGVESDDDGDLFRASYEECSGESKVRRARRLFDTLQAEIGIYPHYRLTDTIDEIDAGMTSAHIREEYASQHKKYHELQAIKAAQSGTQEGA